MPSRTTLLVCPKCMKEAFRGPAKPKMKDYVVCSSCGHRFRVEEFGKAAVKRASEELLRAQKDRGRKPKRP